MSISRRKFLQGSAAATVTLSSISVIEDNMHGFIEVKNTQEGAIFIIKLMK